MFARLPSCQVRRSLLTRQCRRQLSTTSGSSAESSTTWRIRTTIATTAVIVSGTLFAVYYFDSRSAIHRYVTTPLLRHTLDPELSHKLAVKVLRSGLAPKDKGVDDERLRAELWGKTLSNPIGLAAGFDKNGEAIDGLFDFGFSWVEIGSVTPKPQPGNPKPRVFHLPEDNAIINRYGFPSEGAVSVLSRLRSRLPHVLTQGTDNLPASERASLRPDSLLAINLGKNKTSPPDSPDDFLHGVRLFAPFADVLVVNVSSPNTPGLRGMQTRGLVEELLRAITMERDFQSQLVTKGKRRPRVVLKIAPDLDETQVVDIAEAVKATPGVDGIIVSNTTVQRPALLTPDPRTEEVGGLSGPPLKPLTLRVLRTLRSRLPASIPIIGCGGISTGEDALEYARAGASFVQLYTAFGYDGPGACRRIKDELKQILEREGTTWHDVVQNAVAQLSEKIESVREKGSDVVASETQNEKGKPETSFSVLVEEALAIKKQLEVLGERLGEKAKEGAAESSPPTV